MTIPEIIEEINKENGSNYKKAVLEKHKDNDLLQRVLKMTYDKVAFTYGVTMKNVIIDPNVLDAMTLEEVLDEIEGNFVTRKITGNKALELLGIMIAKLSGGNADIIKKLITRDLRINIGRSIINKVFKGLITKPAYMRCGIYTIDKEVNGKVKKGTCRDISFPALVQLKADGTYREFQVEGDDITCRSRSGESYEYPVLFEALKGVRDGVYTGELTVRGIDNRAEANGLINSSDPPHEDIIVHFWDYISLEEYSKAIAKDKRNPCKTTYFDRWTALTHIIECIDDYNVELIPNIMVKTLREATNQTTEWMNYGFEGAILKDRRGLFKDGTSKHQLKIKVAFTVDVRITGFVEGTPDTKREATFGSITFETDDGLVKGSCSGFNDAQLEDFNGRREELIGKIMEVEANDLTKGRSNDFHALSHPRFIELRDDKDSTDSLERAQDSLESAKNFK
tara:strand:- start:2226 stop:3584 length:1359 start_codon:yes stop_codon:yes gene_type:complete